MMFSLSFAVFLLINLGVNGQPSIKSPTSIENGYPFGKLRLSEDGKTEELIASANTETARSFQVPSLNTPPTNLQPLPSPCTGMRPTQKLAFPSDKTKYIQCRDEFHYEILTCPNGGVFNEKSNACDLPPPSVIDRCEEEKPCLYGGQCTLLSNSSFLCTCTPGWTGARCEIPLNSCSKNPCGPTGECKIIKTTDYEKDYVCICNERSTYGITCQDVVQNPCLSTTEEFFPYAFSQHAYIQCDGEIMFVQPCGPLLYWNQDDKNCDRKRSKKVDTRKLITKLSSSTKNGYQKERNTEIVKPEIILTTVAPIEQPSPYAVKGKEMDQAFVGFMPATLVNRQQIQSNMNNQRSVSTQNARDTEYRTVESRNPLSQSIDYSQVQSEFVSKPQQWTNQQSETIERQPTVAQSGRNQFSAQNTLLTPQNRVVSSPTSTFARESNIDQFQMGQNSQRFAAQTPSRQDSRLFSRQEEVASSYPEATSLDAKNRFSKNMQETNQFGIEQQTGRNQQVLQNRGNGEFRQSFTQSETAPVDAERLPLDSEHSFVTQSVKNQQQTPGYSFKVSSDLNNGQLQRGVQSQDRQDDQPQQDFLSQTKPFGTQQWLNQIPDAKVQSTQRFAVQPQARQTSQTTQNQPMFFADTPTTAQRLTNSQSAQNSQNQEENWQNQLSSQPIQTAPIKSQSSQGFAFSSKQNHQDNVLTSQSQSQKYNQQPLLVDSYSQTENTQYGLNQQPKSLPVQNSYEQKQSWSSSQQLPTQESQMTDSDDFQPQPSQSFNARPLTSSQTKPRSAVGQFTPSLFKTEKVPSKGVSSQSSFEWQPSRTIEQYSQDNTQIAPQTTTTNQRKVLSWTPVQSY